MLDQITPVILTYNEAPNIGRTLEKLSWARDVVVVDSFSNDETLEIVSTYSPARVYQRHFDNFAAQWTFAVQETDIKTGWVLGLDADMLLTDEVITELQSMIPSESDVGYRVPTAYCVQGKALRFSLLPPLTVLYRRNAARFSADAHTYQLLLDGNVGRLRANILHDDRKSLRHWFEAQQRYMQLEAAKILSANRESLNLADRIRRLRVIAPFAVFFYCLLRGGVLDGWAGVYYATQRSVAELMLSLYLLEDDLQLRSVRRIELDQRDSESIASVTESVDAARAN